MWRARPVIVKVPFARPVRIARETESSAIAMSSATRPVYFIRDRRQPPARDNA